MQFLLWLRVTKLNKAGTAPIYLRIFLDNLTRVEYATGLRCKPSQWGGGERKITGQSQAARLDNATLDTLKARARLLASDMQTARTSNPDLPRLLPADVAAALRPQKQAQKQPAEPLLIDLLRDALPRHSPRASTRLTYARAVNWLEKWPGAKRLRLAGLTAEVASKFVGWLAQQSPAAGTQRAYLYELGSLLTTAAPAHPAVFAKLGRQLGAVAEPVRRILPPDWQQQLQTLRLPKKQALARDAFFLAYYLHGSRIGVIVELQWAHIDEKQGRVRFTTHKRPVNKNIVLNEPLLEILARYRGRGSAFVLPLLPPDYLSLSEEEQLQVRHRHIKNLGDNLDLVAGKLGWPKLNPHLARHTFALASYKKNSNDLRVPQQLLGHKDISTTAKYIASLTTDELDQSAANAYD